MVCWQRHLSLKQFGNATAVHNSIIALQRVLCAVAAVSIMANLDQIAENQRKAVLRAFNDVIASIRDTAQINDITALIDAGRVDDVIDLLQLNRARFAGLEQAITESYRTGGEAAIGQIGRVPVDGMNMRIVFDMRSPAAESWLMAMSSNRVVEIVTEQRNLIRSALTEGIARGDNPRTTALDIVGRIDPVTRTRTGGVVGLTENQQQWVSNARQELNDLNSNYLTRKLRDRRFDKTIARAMENGEPLTQSQIDRAITQMQNRALKYRADTISRTESLNALRAGHHQAIMQAVNDGDVDKENTYHTWDATGGQRTRDWHMSADGQRKPIDQPFEVDGELLQYPGDPAGSAGNVINCRCRERIEIDFAGSLKKVDGFR